MSGRSSFQPGASEPPKSGRADPPFSELLFSNLPFYLALVLASGLWGASLLGVDPSSLRAMGEFGLVTFLPLSFYAALALLTLSFGVAVFRPHPPKHVLFAMLVLFILMVHATPTLLYDSLRYSWAYKHVGLVDYILRFETVNRTIADMSAYHNWPGFFSASALLVRALGVDSALGLASWGPVFFNLLNLGALWLLFTALVPNERQVWTALWLYFITSWVAQDYFSPQAVAFFFYLVALGVVAKWFTDRNRYGLASRPHKRWRFMASAPPGDPDPQSAPLAAPRTPSKAMIASLLLLLSVLFATLATSHQLTPIVTILALAVLALFTRKKPLGLPLLMGVMTVAWLVYGAAPFFQEVLRELVDSFGRLSGNLDDTLISLSALSEGQQLIALAGRALTLLVWFLAFAGVLKQLKNGSLDLGLLLLAGAPFLLLAGNSYGGEIIFRVYLFSLPFMALWVAYLLTSGVRAARWWHPLPLTSISLLLLTGFVLAYFGKEQQFYFAPSEVEAAKVMYSLAPEGSLIVEGDPNYPSRYTDYEHYTHVAISREPPESRNEVLADPTGSMREWLGSDAYSDAYLILTRSQAAGSEPLKDLAVGSIDAIWRALLSSPDFRVVYSGEDAVVFTLQDALKNPPTELP